MPTRTNTSDTSTKKEHATTIFIPLPPFRQPVSLIRMVNPLRGPHMPFNQFFSHFCHRPRLLKDSKTKKKNTKIQKRKQIRE
jgi:hypothetical protein